MIFRRKSILGRKKPGIERISEACHRLGSGPSDHIGSREGSSRTATSITNRQRNQSADSLQNETATAKGDRALPTSSGPASVHRRECQIAIFKINLSMSSIIAVKSSIGDL